jgi:hypothetical protein
MNAADPSPKTKANHVQARVFPPSRNPTVKEIKKESKRHIPHGGMNVTSIIRHKVSHAAEDRHSAANTVHERDNVSEIKIAKRDH